MPEETTFRIPNPDGRRELIMIVDDDALVTLLVERVLTMEGYRVVTAGDGSEALRTYKKYKSQIQLVILDYKMPDMDGFALFNELRNINPNVPAVLTSGFVEQEDLDVMLAKGLRGFIPKPLTQQKLLSKVRALLDEIAHGIRLPSAPPEE
jgi:CheY-like chemotaxis protein